MAGANSNISLVGLDFDVIKNNLKTYLKSQDVFKDYNFDGSGLSVLLDVLAYNTQYNAFYLNMVANEMFLDTSLQRSSVVSHAKLLNYTPKSATAPAAIINITANNVTDTSVTLPAYTNFLSEAINKINYNFVTVDSVTLNTDPLTQSVIFNDIIIKEGIPVNYTFTVDSTSNPTYVFELPDSSVDSSTVRVMVQQSSSNTYSSTYTVSNKYLTLDGTSEVFFIAESVNGNYEITFGNGILGKKLVDGNLVKVSYIITQGKAAIGANNFVLMDPLPGLTDVTISGKLPAGHGSGKESIDSIKFQAPKLYASQNRGVTKTDYIALINQNSLGISFDAVNVWGGEENVPPAYGQVFICVKPTGSYTLNNTQKQRLIEETLNPVSIMTVTPTMVDPDYTYIRVVANVVYDPDKTNLNSSQIKEKVRTAIQSFSTSTLNTFNSSFMSSKLTDAISSVDTSIITNEINIQVQKKFYPNLVTPRTYNLQYGTSLKKGMFQGSVNSYPAIRFTNKSDRANTINGVYLEEIPQFTSGVDSIYIANPGFAYQYPPTVTILGDGSGATATSTINTIGQITGITVTSSGNNYTSAVATITPDPYDTTGKNGVAIVNLQGKYGTLRTFYYNSNNVKTVLNSNAGIIDYENGVLTLNNFGPIQVDNDLGQLTISATPTSTLISSSFNRILTMDVYDPNSVLVNVFTK